MGETHLEDTRLEASSLEEFLMADTHLEDVQLQASPITESQIAKCQLASSIMNYLQ